MDGPTQLSLPQPRRAPAAAKAGTCLEVDELVAMVDGTLASERSDAVLAHVDACSTCADLVGSLGVLDEEPRRFGRYRIDRLLGVGGMGMVYRAWDPELRRPVAIKLVRPEHASERSRARMLGEARALARVSHPNVVAVYDVGEHAGEIFLATELVEGETLAGWRTGRTAVELVDAWLQVARGLAAAHAERVVHRDVKPANVLVGRDGRMRIGDFGIAYQLGGAETETRAAERSGSGSASDSGSASASDSDSGSASASDSGSASVSASASEPASSSAPRSAHGTPAQPITVSEIVGTPAYMAPEQHEGKVDARSDQFSVCVALVEALTGRRPAPGERVVLPALTDALADVLRRGLRADPAARFPSMSAFADALAATLPPPLPPARRRPFAVAAAALVLALAAIAATVGLRRSSAGACEIATIPERVWSPARRLKLGPWLPAEPEPLLRGWLAEWSATAADVCVTSRATPELQARRGRCLAERLTRLDRTLARWESAPPRDALKMFVMVGLIPRPAQCSHAALLATPEPTPRQLAEQEPISREMTLLTLQPELATRLAEGSRLVERARDLGYAPFAIEVSRTLASMQAGVDRGAARKTLQAAIDLPATGGDSFERVTAMIELIALLDSSAEAEALAESTRGRLLALGGNRALEATLDDNLGKVLQTAHRSDEALAALERAHRGYRAVDGPDGPREANALVALAGVHYQRDNSRAGDAAFAAAGAIFKRLGMPTPLTRPEKDAAAVIEQLEQLQVLARRAGPRTEAMFNAEHALGTAHVIAEQPDRALEHYRLGVELGDELGLRNDKMVFSLTQMAMLLIDQKRLDEAAEPARRAMELAEQLGLENEVTNALGAQGRLALERGDVVAARKQLARALERRLRANAPSQVRGITRFLLARALWGADDRRALELAHAARADLQGFLDSADPTVRGAEHLRRTAQERLEEVDRWLRERAR